MKVDLLQLFESEGARRRSRDSGHAYEGDDWGAEFDSESGALRAVVAVALEVGRDLGNDRCSNQELAAAEELSCGLERISLSHVGLVVVVA